MATKSGRLGVLYWGASTAVAVAETHDAFGLSLSTDYAEDTSHGDTYRTRIPTLKDFTLSFEKWFDTAYHTLIDAAIASTTGKFYLYPDRTDNTIYWYGTGYVGLEDYNVGLEDTVNESYQLVPTSQPTYVHP
jgi:hypothetical protein